MPARPLGLVHPPIDNRGLGFLRTGCHFTQELLAQGLDLGFGFGQRCVKSPLKRSAMRDAGKAQRLSQAGVLGQKRRQLLGFEGPQYYSYHRQQQEGPAGEGPRTAPMAAGRRGYVVFFDLSHYLEQCVGGDGGVVGSHNPRVCREFLLSATPDRFTRRLQFTLVVCHSRMLLVTGFSPKVREDKGTDGSP